MDVIRLQMERSCSAFPIFAGPQHNVRDAYVAGIDRGFLEETDEFGLQGVYYTSLAGLGCLRRRQMPRSIVRR